MTYKRDYFRLFYMQKAYFHVSTIKLVDDNNSSIGSVPDLTEDIESPPRKSRALGKWDHSTEPKSVSNFVTNDANKMDAQSYHVMHDKIEEIKRNIYGKNLDYIKTISDKKVADYQMGDFKKLEETFANSSLELSQALYNDIYKDINASFSDVSETSKIDREMESVALKAAFARKTIDKETYIEEQKLIFEKYNEVDKSSVEIATWLKGELNEIMLRLDIPIELLGKNDFYSEDEIDGENDSKSSSENGSLLDNFRKNRTTEVDQIPEDFFEPSLFEQSDDTNTDNTDNTDVTNSDNTDVTNPDNPDVSGADQESSTENLSDFQDSSEVYPTDFISYDPWGEGGE